MKRTHQHLPTLNTLATKKITFPVTDTRDRNDMFQISEHFDGTEHGHDDITFELDKFLEVMGPGLFPLCLILSLIPFAIPAIPLATWAEAYYEEQHKGNMPNHQLSHNTNSSMAGHYSPLSKTARHDSMSNSSSNVTKSLTMMTSTVQNITGQNEIQHNDLSRCKKITMRNIEFATSEMGTCVLTSGETLPNNLQNPKFIQLSTLELVYDDRSGQWIVKTTLDNNKSETFKNSVRIDERYRIKLTQLPLMDAISGKENDTAINKMHTGQTVSSRVDHK